MLLSEIIRELSFDLTEREACLDFSEESFVSSGPLYYFDCEKRLQKSSFIRIGNAFYFEFQSPTQTTAKTAVFFKLGNRFYQTALNVGAEKKIFLPRALKRYSLLLEKKDFFRLKQRVLSQYSSRVPPEEIVKNEIVYEFLKGKSFKDIAEKREISRQRVEQIVRRLRFLSFQYLNQLSEPVAEAAEKVRKEFEPYLDLLTEVYGRVSIRPLLLNSTSGHCVGFFRKGRKIFLLQKGQVFETYFGPRVATSKRILSLSPYFDDSTFIVYLFEASGRKTMVEKRAREAPLQVCIKRAVGSLTSRRSGRS